MVTLFDWFGKELPMDERYRLIKAAGFDGTFLWWGDDFGKTDYRFQPECARKHGLFVEDIHTPFANCNAIWLDNLDGEAETEQLLSCVADCNVYDIPTMIVHLSNGANPPPFCALGLDRMKRIAERAEQKGVNVALENLRKTEYLEFVLSRISSHRVGFCYDSGHQNCRTPNEDLLTKYGSRLMALHLHDNDGYVSGAGEEDQHRLPFDGTIDWGKTMRQIAAAGYEGPIALEATNAGYETLPPEEFLRLAYERAKKLEAMKE